MEARSIRQRFDHRLRDLIHETGDVDVEGHNTRPPRSAFDGQTPDEMYFGTGADVPIDLAERRKEARAKRMETHRVRSCRVCREAVAN